MTTKKRTQQRPEGKVDERAIADLAEKVAAVLTHPPCPDELYDELIDGINNCVSSRDINHYPGYLIAIFTEKAKEGASDDEKESGTPGVQGRHEANERAGRRNR